MHSSPARRSSLPGVNLPGINLPGMNLPPAVLAGLANFVRQRLAEVQGTLSPLWGRGEPRRGAEAPQCRAKDVAGVVVCATAPFAHNSYARTRLLRQMHAAGLLTATEARSAERVLEAVDGAALGGPAALGVAK